jgi:hypothetical protein
MGSIFLSIFVVKFNAQIYYVGLFQTGILDTSYKTLLWMPAYVQVTKMIPSDVEVFINSIVKTLQAGSMQVWGRLLGTGLIVIFEQFRHIDKMHSCIIVMLIAMASIIC